MAVKVDIHETREVVLKKADIDKKMVTVIEWLNSFGDVFTRYCCEGRGKDIPATIVFICVENGDLLSILETIRGLDIEVTVDWKFEAFPLRYCMKIANRKTLRVLTSIVADVKPTRVRDGQAQLQYLGGEK